MNSETLVFLRLGFSNTLKNLTFLYYVTFLPKEEFPNTGYARAKKREWYIRDINIIPYLVPSIPLCSIWSIWLNQPWFNHWESVKRYRQQVVEWDKRLRQEIWDVSQRKLEQLRFLCLYYTILSVDPGFTDTPGTFRGLHTSPEF